jgi:DNA primase large subunit
MEFFKFKFTSMTTAEIKDFIELYEMGYRPISDEQKQEVRMELQNSSTGNVDNIDFYKVNFLQVLDLVRLRKCFLKAGFAYVSSHDFSSIIGGHHQKFIEKGLLSHLKFLPEFENDERIVGIIKGLHTSYVGKDYTVNKDADIPIESLDQLSLKSYPICMRMCHESLRKTHHMKHAGRIQYGLFLKGIGVTLEDSLRFWREEMTKNMEPDKFDKSYAYGIRYNYGKEGSRTNWSPYSCNKIITTVPGAQDVAGCPFKLWDSIELRSKLSSYGLNPIATQEVVSYASKGHFQLACGRYFEAVHETRLDEGVNHPNGYFENSQIIMGTRQAKEKPKSSAQSSFNQRKQIQMNKQQEFKRKMEAKVKEEKDFEEELWKLSQREEELLSQWTARQDETRREIEEISQLNWEDEKDDEDMAEVSNYL